MLHAVPVGHNGADVDHVLIGPGGIFTINTKTHIGKKVTATSGGIYVNGYRTDYLRNSRFEGKRATKLLTAALGSAVTVTPVLIILTTTFSPPLVTIKQQPEGVLVLPGADVQRVFTRMPPTLTPNQVGAVFEVARRSTTWQTH